MINKTLATTAYEIVLTQINLQKDADHRFFRIKNFTEEEIIEFVNYWQIKNSLGKVRLVVANNINNSIPNEYIADDKKSITYYRNNNKTGLVYIETKIQSDEQGLQNIYTLHDSNFLDGSFDIDYAGEEFVVSEAIINNAWNNLGGTSKLSELLKKRILEVLHSIESFEKVSLRNYAKFVVNILSEFRKVTTALSDEAVNELVGKNLIFLDCFPDSFWRLDEKKSRRRLQLNRNYSDLVSGSSDIDPDLLIEKVALFQFKDINKNELDTTLNQEFRNYCSNFIKAQSTKTRENIPFYIFEQLFLPDVSGLQLGERVFIDIEAADNDRIQDLIDLNVVDGLNRRIEEDARRFLEYDQGDDKEKLRNLLKVSTRRLVEQLANPKAKQFFNPLLEIIETVESLKNIFTLDNKFSLLLRLGKNADLSNQSLRLFNFLFGNSLRSVSDKSSENSFGLKLKIDPLLIQTIVPSEIIETDESSDDESEEEVPLWSPIPITFDLLDSEGKVLHSIGKMEWYPVSEDLHYFSFFWLLLCAKESNFKSISAGIQVPLDGSLERILIDFGNRVIPLSYVQPFSQFQPDPAISDLLNIRSEYLEKLSINGVDVEAINEYLDSWQPLFASTRTSLVPDGTRIPAISQLLDLDFLCLPGSRKVMIPSHPIRLRWISQYLLSCEMLVSSFLNGEAEISNINPNFYLEWLRTLTPSQCPAIASSVSGEVLFSSGDQAWFEEFLPRSEDITGAVLDIESTRKVSKQITSYLEAHPYKRDGLSILLLAPYTNKFPSDLISSIKSGDWKGVCINLTVITHRSKWHEISTHFDKLLDENRMVNDDRLFPLYDLSFIEYRENTSLSEMVEDQKFDIAVITHLLNEDVTPQNNTEAPNLSSGSFDPLLDRPTYLSGGIKGGAISILMKPDQSDEILETWSTQVIRSNRLRPVMPSQPENTDFLELRVNFESSSKIFVELHEICHWVVTLERHISRQQIESLETSPDILSIEEGVGSNNNFTLIVSANSGKSLIISRIARKLERLLAESKLLHRFNANPIELADTIYSQTRKFAPRLALKAMGISMVTEEIIGLMVARSLARLSPPIDSVDSKWIYASISLDEHQDWFGGSAEIRADICNLCFSIINNNLHVNVEVIEGKLRQTYDPHGVFQAKSTCEFFEDVLLNVNRVDSKLWREQIISAIETADSKAVSISGFSQTEFMGIVPFEIREKFRDGDYIVDSIKGLYSICITEGVVKPIWSENQNGVDVVRSSSADIISLILSQKDMKKTIVIDKAPSIVAPNTVNPNLINVSNISVNTFSTVGEVGVDTIPERPMENIASTGDGVRERNLDSSELREMYQTILDCFSEQGVEVDPAPASEKPFIEGPASILFKFSPRGSTDPKKLKDKSQILKLKLKLEQDQEIMFSIDKGYVNIDVPKLPHQRYFVLAQDMWSHWSRPQNLLSAPLGEDRFGNIVDLDFSNSLSPHLLIGGTTGSGKSEALNVLLYGLVNFYSPKELRLLLVDPKGTELLGFSNAPHLEGTISWDDVDALALLKTAVIEMQSRYEKLRESSTRTIAEYNSKVGESDRLPWWLVVLDEYADLTSDPSMKKEIEVELKRLAQKARAAGIHVIIATQKPSAEVISTNLRANLPAQLALRVERSAESRVIMDDSGAEMLNGKGDAYLKAGGSTTRVQCGLVTKDEAEKIIKKFS
jgi:S-DNA-T family DNA segregation ATPase FtsK/SpoIIIE